MSLREAFMKLYLKNKRTGETFTVKPHDPASGMLWIDDGDKTVLLNGKSLEPWEVEFPLVIQRDELEPGFYECQIEFSYPNEPTYFWNKNKDWDNFGFWSGTIESQSFELEIIEETPKTIKALLPEKLHYDKEKRTINYTKDEAIEVELPIRNGCFLGVNIYVYNSKNGEFNLSTQCGYEVIKPDMDIRNNVNSPENEKFLYKLKIFETDEPPIHMWSPESGDYKVLWEKNFEFGIDE